MIDKWRIENLESGVVLGVYPGRTAAEALDAMARDAGYKDYAEACRESGDEGNLSVTMLNRAARALASIRSPARAAASRENGKKGGRPRKS